MWFLLETHIVLLRNAERKAVRMHLAGSVRTAWSERGAGPEDET
jgi:hypothetical protein